MTPLRLLGLGVAVVSLLATGCRSCGERNGLFSRFTSATDELLCSRTRGGNGELLAGPAVNCLPTGSPVSGIMTSDAGRNDCVAQPSFGVNPYPMLPQGTPVPLRTPGMGQPNELPYPTIPPPGVPELPARPESAVPFGKVPSLPKGDTTNTATKINE
jgi:hypothetical protein